MSISSVPASDGRVGRVGRVGLARTAPAPDDRLRGDAVRAAAEGEPPAPPAFPPPQSIVGDHKQLIWNEDADPVENYQALGKCLAAAGDLYRRPNYAGGLLLVAGNAPPVIIDRGHRLAPVIIDRVRVQVIQDDRTTRKTVPSAHLSAMLASEAFLQEFRPLDAVVRSALYLPHYCLTQPGYNDGGPGQRILHLGPAPRVERTPDAVNRFLNVMDFSSSADRTNAVALALTVMLRNFWPGGKPVGVVTSTKSHGGKETVIAFAAGTTPKVSVDYESADWAFRQGLVAGLLASPDAGVVNVENARLGRGEKYIASATLERCLTDPEPALHSSKVRDALKVANLVFAISTNEGTVSEDLMNRTLPVHLNPVGDVANRVSPIGNPKHEYLPAHREQIEAELRGMIEIWKEAGRPLDTDVRHPFSDWAKTVGGILQVNGYRDFLGNYSVRRTADDSVRRALGLLGAARPETWQRAGDWAKDAARLGLTKPLIAEADRDSDAGRVRGMGVTLTAHRDETFQVESDDERLTLRLERGRRRFQAGPPSTRYRFSVVARETLPEDAEDAAR